MRFLKFLRSPGLALGVLLFLGAYGGAAVWLPFSSLPAAQIPQWARALGLDHPFLAPPFLIPCALLFVNTLVCTWDRTNRVRTLWRGTLPPGAPMLDGGRLETQRAFLLESGFRARGEILFRSRFALWGGWVMHAGLLVLMAGVLVQQGFHEGGTFELAEGEVLALDAQRALLDRTKGPLAAASPPAIEVGLVNYDFSLHQRGYSPDRGSRLRLTPRGGTPVEAFVDRSAGVTLRGTTIFQAIPTGLALTVEAPNLGARSIHLYGSGRGASAEVTDPAGVPTRFVVEAERDLSDRTGTGRLGIRMERAGAAIPLAPGRPFPFGNGEATLRAVSRWSAFTYTRSPGTPAVFVSFILVLTGCTFMVFPAGVARYDADAGSHRVYLTRGSEALMADWQQRGRA